MALQTADIARTESHEGMGRRRWPAVDAARGVAIVAMATYHFAWDLSFFHLIATDIVAEPAWRLLARATAASFLTLVGVGLVLAHGESFRPRAFARRILVVGGAALGITLVTWFVFPDQYIFFGILHCIAVSSLLGLVFLRAPVAVTTGVAALVFAAPVLFTAPALDHPALAWLGLGARVPLTNDYVPIFPWFGFVLLGIAGTRLVLPFALRASSDRAGWRDPLSRALIWSGRRSLAIYLLHQPLLLGLLFLVASLAGPDPAAGTASFRTSCEAGCAEAGAEKAVCPIACGCMEEHLRAEGLWDGALANKLGAAERQRVSWLGQQCLAAAKQRLSAPR